MAVPAHLRTDFKPEDSDIRTLVQNVLKSRNRLREVKSKIEDLVLMGSLSTEIAEVLITIINKPED